MDPQPQPQGKKEIGSCLLLIIHFFPYCSPNDVDDEKTTALN